MKILQIAFCLQLMGNILYSQNDQPLWDIGTKWTYELQLDQHTTTFATDAIIDTTTINGKLLYLVHSEPEWHGIQYFHYEGNRVYNYSPTYDILQLLYDFSNDSSYVTEYRPICDPDFEYSGDTSKMYSIRVDSITEFEMPDSTLRSVNYYSPLDTVFELNDTFVIDLYQRSVLYEIGFLQGGLHYTHDWEIGDYVCNEWGNFIRQLRCFENDSISYNFSGYPCDSTWVLSNTRETLSENVKIYPNPTKGIINVDGMGSSFEYEVYSSNGVLMNRGKSANGIISLNNNGLSIVKIRNGDHLIIKRVFKLE
jgi:hypothetical protein